MFVDRFPFEKRTSRMVYHGVIVVWFLPVFPCLPFVSFLVFMPFLGQFLLASFPPSFLSVVPVCFFPILFFLLLHLHFVKFLLSACKYSFYPAVLFSRLVLRSGTKPKRRQKTKAKFTTSSLAWTWPGAGKPSSPSCYYCKPLPLPLRGLVVLLLQAFVLPAPAKHQQRLHHRDYCCCWCSCCWCWCCWCWCW